MTGGKKEKTENINIRCTPQQKATLSKLASIAGLSVSAYVLGQALGDLVGQVLLSEFNKDK